MNDDGRRIDLHTHTTASDGVLAPAALVEEAVWKGLSAVGITDHDNLGGLAEAAATGARRGIEVVPGVEISCIHGGAEVHLLGYEIERPDAIETALAPVLAHRRTRMDEMIDRAVSLGLPVTRAAVEAESRGASVGRPHLARALVAAGAVRSVGEAFERYLGDRGTLYVPKRRLTTAEAVACLRAAGAVAIIAHPGASGLWEVLDELADEGAEGVEAYYSAHTREDTERLRAFATRRGLLVTGGSDFHGPGIPGRDLGQPPVLYACLAALRAHKAARRV